MKDNIMRLTKIIAMMSIVGFCGYLGSVSLEAQTTETYEGISAAHAKPFSTTLGTIKTFKVVLANSDVAYNRTVYVQAKDGSDARKTAEGQNPGWKAQLAIEVKNVK